MSARVSLLFALLVAVLGTGCGGKSEDQALAERAVLELSDLPSDWYATDLEETLVDRCVNFDVSGLVVRGRAHSDWFSAPGYADDVDVASFSGVYEDSADEALEQLADEATQCIREERGAAGTGIAGLLYGKGKVREISLPRMGESSRAYEIKHRFGLLVLYEDVVLIRKGRSLALLYFSFDQFAFDAADHLMVELAETVASRM